MRALSLIFGFVLALPPCALAQYQDPVDSDGITTFASRTLTLQPDQVTITATVESKNSITLERALQLLDGTGAVASESRSQAQDGTYYEFQFNRPAASLAEWTPKLRALSSNPPPGITLSFDARLTLSAAATERLRDTVIAQLVTEAQRKAQSIASATGLKLGAIQSVSDDRGLGYRIVLSDRNVSRLGGILVTTRNGIVVSQSSVFGTTDLRATYMVNARFAVQ
jgi:hypothetical protein